MRSFVSLGVGFALFLAGCATDDEVGASREAVHACGTLPDGGTRWCADEGWDGGYNCVDKSCHEASNNLNPHKGILSCHGFTGGPYGHTINWDHPVPGTVCLENPQAPGEGPAELQSCNGTTVGSCIAVIGCVWTGWPNNGSCGGTPKSPLVLGGTCCWSADLNAQGVPDLTTPGAQACLGLLCPTVPGTDPPIAFPPGQQWDTTYLDCAGNNPNNVPACAACCEANANAVPDEWGTSFVCEREDYRDRCRTSCGAGPSPTPRRPCECITDRQQCLDARCGWRLDGLGCMTVSTTPPLPPVPDAATDAGVDSGTPDGHVMIPEAGDLPPARRRYEDRNESR